MRLPAAVAFTALPEASLVRAERHFGNSAGADVDAPVRELAEFVRGADKRHGRAGGGLHGIVGGAVGYDDVGADLAFGFKIFVDAGSCHITALHYPCPPSRRKGLR